MKTALRFLVLSNLRAEIKFGGFHDKEKKYKALGSFEIFFAMLFFSDSFRSVPQYFLLKICSKKPENYLGDLKILFLNKQKLFCRYLYTKGFTYLHILFLLF